MDIGRTKKVSEFRVRVIFLREKARVPVMKRWDFDIDLWCNVKFNIPTSSKKRLECNLVMWNHRFWKFCYMIPTDILCEVWLEIGWCVLKVFNERKIIDLGSLDCSRHNDRLWDYLIRRGMNSYFFTCFTKSTFSKQFPILDLAPRKCPISRPRIYRAGSSQK